MTTSAEPRDTSLRLFWSYAHEDRVLLEEIKKHFSVLERSGLIAGWDDRMITAGSEWEGRILDALERADVILLLISADFLASDYCWDVEMRRALIRHSAEEALVVPIILRPCDWAEAPFSRLQCLPSDGKPIVSWSPQDSGYLDVTEGLRKALVDAARAHRRSDPSDIGEPPSPGTKPERAEARVMDAAIGSVVPVGRATDIVAMVRTHDSGGLRTILELDSSYSARPDDVKASDFTMGFPVDADGRPEKVQVSLRLESSDFDPPLQEKTIEVRPGEDSRTCVFLATAQREGPLMLNLELRHRGVSVVQQLLRANGSAGVERRTMPSYVVHSTDYSEGRPRESSPPPPTSLPRTGGATPPPSRGVTPPPSRSDESTGDSIPVQPPDPDVAEPSPRAEPSPAVSRPPSGEPSPSGCLGVLIAVPIGVIIVIVLSLLLISGTSGG